MEYKPIKVKLLGYMGSDTEIEQAARLSYDKAEEKRLPEQTESLIRYLFWHRHTSPFEMCEVKFLIEMPIFTARQMVRHRTASINEISRRYTNENIEFFDVELRKKDTSKTKQGSGEVLPKDSYFPDYDILDSVDEERIGEVPFDVDVYSEVDRITLSSLDLYQWLIKNGISNETARAILPHNLMTKWVWKIDLHNLFHFLNLRLDDHAQKEIRIVATAILNAISPLFPMAVKAFVDWKTLHDAFKDSFYKVYKRGGLDTNPSLISTIADFIRATSFSIHL